MAEIIYDKDPSLRLEETTFLRKILDFFWIPFLNHLPENFGQKFFEKSSSDGKKVKELATTFKAIEVFYKFDGKLHFKKNINNPFVRTVDAVFTWIWQRVHNVKSVRNRLKIVVRELEFAFQYFFEKKDAEISLVSFGAGSARAPYEVLQHLKEKNILDTKIKITLIDKAQESLDYSEYLAKKYAVSAGVSFHRIKTTIGNFLETSHEKINIVEIAGLFDYFDDENFQEKTRSIYKNLKGGGSLIVSNIMPNKERPFVEKIIKWEGMHHREADDLIRLLKSSGFNEKNIKVFIEPQQIHMIAVAQKNTYA